MIRPAKETDLMQLYQMCVKAHELGPHNDSHYDRSAIIRTLRHCIANKHRCLFVDDASDGLKGMIAGFITDSWWNENKKAAGTFVFHTEPGADAEGLLSWFTTWAWTIKSVCAIQVSRVQRYELGEHVFTDAGLEHSGGVYTQKRPESIKEQSHGLF